MAVRQTEITGGKYFTDKSLFLKDLAVERRKVFDSKDRTQRGPKVSSPSFAEPILASFLPPNP